MTKRADTELCKLADILLRQVVHDYLINEDMGLGDIASQLRNGLEYAVGSGKITITAIASAVDILDIMAGNRPVALPLFTIRLQDDSAWLDFIYEPLHSQTHGQYMYRSYDIKTRKHLDLDPRRSIEQAVRLVGKTPSVE